VLFGTDQDPQRVNYKSIRPEDKWPREDVFLDIKKGIAYLFASPVDKKTGIIGDFGITIYFGKNAAIKKLLKLCYQLDQQIFDYTRVGMRFSEVTSFAEKLFTKYGLANEIISITDVSVVNIGHTIPAAYESWSKEEQSLLAKGEEDWEKLKHKISNKRRFVNNNEDFLIKPGVAFTIEPRPKLVAEPHLPTSLSYHTVVLFKENGEKELLTNFDKIFTLTKMMYMMH
jgi:hypothetical protein